MAEPARAWREGPLRSLKRGPKVVFAQVREDVSLESSFARGRTLCIASGGDTAFSLLATGAEGVVAVDINPAQVWLVQLKLAAIRELPYDSLLNAMTGDARSGFAQVRASVPCEAAAYFDRHRRDLERGLQNCGDVERNFPRLVRLFEFCVVRRRYVDALLALENPSDQSSLFAARWNSWRWRAANNVAFSRMAVRLALGAGFARAGPGSFATEFRDSMARVLADIPAASNPYVWQTFRGRYPPGVLPPWLTETGIEALRPRLERLSPVVGDVAEVLRASASEPFDLVCLSNVLDGATDDYRRALVDSILVGTRPGSTVIRRSFFDSGLSLVEVGRGRLKTKDIPDWTDRSFFCRHVEIVEVVGK